MRRDGVAVCEGVEADRELPAIGQRNAAVLDLPDLNALAIDKVLAVVGLEQEPVTGADFQFTGFSDIKGAGGTGRNKIHFRSIGTANTQAVFHDGGNLDRLAPVKLPGLADEAQSLAGFVLAGIFLLGFSPRKRIKNGDSLIVFADDAIRFQCLPHLLCHRFNLRPSGRYQQRRATLFCSGQIGMGSLLIKLTVIRRCFTDRAQFHEFGKRLVGLFGGSEFNDLPERFGLLAADGRKLAEAVIGILFENAERIATGD